MAKTAKKSPVKKTKSAAAKATADKAAAANDNATKSADKSVTLNKLYKFNLFSVVANLVFAILSVVFIGKQTVDLTWAYATKDQLVGSTLGPAYRTLASVEIRYLLAVIFVISAIFSLLLATRLRKTYEAGVKNSTSGVRWIFTGITLGLVLELASLLGGVGDVLTLKLAGGLVFTTAILAWLSERQNKGSKKHYASFTLSVFTGVIAWFPLAGSLLFTAIYGISNFSWYVYTLAGLVLIGFLSIALNQYRQARDGVSAKGYLQQEGKYVSTEFMIKLVVFLVVIIALHK
jgi:heliorhodopsin